MITIEPLQMYLLLFSNALFAAAACLAIVRFQRFYRRLQQFWDTPVGASLINQQEEEIRQSLRTTQRLDERVDEMQQAIKAIATQGAGKRAPTERALPIDNAVRMIRHGASVEDLTRTCGLNIGEARLLQKLHGQTRAASGAK